MSDRTYIDTKLACTIGNLKLVQDFARYGVTNTCRDRVAECIHRRVVLRAIMANFERSDCASRLPARMRTVVTSG